MNTTEWKRFRRFLKSPYFNTNQNLLTLADELRKFHPFYDQEECTKEHIFSKIYGKKKPYKAASFNTLTNQLVKLVNQFFVQETLRNEDGMKRQLRLKTLKEKQLDDLFFKEAERQKNKLLLEENRDEAFHYSMFLLNQEIYLHPKIAESKNVPLSLQSSIFHLQQFILWHSLSWELAAANAKFIKGISLESSLLTLINDSPFMEETNTVDLLFKKEMIQYLRQPANQKFQKLSDHFFRKIHNFTPKNSQTLFLTFLNILIPKIRKEKSQYISTALKVYKLGFSKGIFIKNNELSQTIFLNAIIAGCGCREFDWVDSIFKKYGNLLNDFQKEDTLKYGELLYLYLQGDMTGNRDCFNKVIQIYQDVQQIPVQFNITTRSLLCRTYYELLNKKNPDTAFLEDFCAAFSKYLDRNTLHNVTRIEVFRVFLKNIRLLIKILNDTPNRATIISKFELFLLQNKDIFAYDWFTKKIRELKTIL